MLSCCLCFICDWPSSFILIFFSIPALLADAECARLADRLALTAAARGAERAQASAVSQSLSSAVRNQWEGKIWPLLQAQGALLAGLDRQAALLKEQAGQASASSIANSSTQLHRLADMCEALGAKSERSSLLCRGAAARRVYTIFLLRERHRKRRAFGIWALLLLARARQNLLDQERAKSARAVALSRTLSTWKDVSNEARAKANRRHAQRLSLQHLAAGYARRGKQQLHRQFSRWLRKTVSTRRGGKTHFECMLFARSCTMQHLTHPFIPPCSHHSMTA